MLGGYGQPGFAGPQPMDPQKILAWLQLMQRAPGAIKGIGGGIGSLLGGNAAAGASTLSPLAGMAPAAAAGAGSAAGMATGTGTLASMAPEAAAGAGSAAGTAAGSGSLLDMLAALF